MKKKNNRRSPLAYRKFSYKDLQQLEIANRRIAREEYLSIIQLLYSTQIEESTKPIRYYYDMTWQDASQEIKLRTMIVRAKNNGLEKRNKEKALEAENALLEQLKRR